MKVVHKDKGSDLLTKIPVPPSYLDAAAKRNYKKIAKQLIGAKVLKAIHLKTLEVLSDYASQYEWAVKEIQRKNKINRGSGYVQKFNSGAQNISVEVSLKKDAVKTMLQCIKQFGLDPKSEKDLNLTVGDPDQLSMFEKFLNKKSI